MKKIREKMKLVFFVILDNIHNLTEIGIKNNDVKYQLEHQT